MTRSVVRTGYGADLIAAKAVGGIHVCQQYSTLNEDIALINNSGGMVFVTSGNIQPILSGGGSVAAFSLASWNSSNNADTQAACVQYVAIGDGGVTGVIATNGPNYTVPKGFKARQSGLYNQIPWALKQYSSTNPNWDFTLLEQANYRHRCWVTIGGNLYVAYFLKVLWAVAPTVSLQYVTVTAGDPPILTAVPFSPVLNDLIAPTAPGNTSTADFLQSVAPATLTLSSDDVAELLNVAVVLYGNANQSMITEMAIVNGVDKPCNHSYDSTTLSSSTAPEACGAQCYTFYSANYPVTMASIGLTIDFNLGTTEPLFGV